MLAVKLLKEILHRHMEIRKHQPFSRKMVGHNLINLRPKSMKMIKKQSKLYHRISISSNLSRYRLDSKSRQSYQISSSQNVHQRISF